MNNDNFMIKTEEEKRDKLLRVLNIKLPEAKVEQLVKIVSQLNLKRQYCIKVLQKREHMLHFATEEKIRRKEDIEGINWESSTTSSVKVILGDIIPGLYKNIDGEEEYKDTEYSLADGTLFAFIKENRNIGYMDFAKPEFENFLYLYSEN